jgi:heterodisulfide reductase subunit C
LLASPTLWYCMRCAQCSFSCPQDVRFLDIVQGLRHLAVREGAISPARAARLAAGEKAIQELRRQLVAALLAAPEDDADLRAELVRALENMEIPPPEEE